jgi:hypothetical protein
MHQPNISFFVTGPASARPTVLAIVVLALEKRKAQAGAMSGSELQVGSI